MNYMHAWYRLMHLSPFFYALMIGSKDVSIVKKKSNQSVAPFIFIFLKNSFLKHNFKKEAIVVEAGFGCLSFSCLILPSPFFHSTQFEHC